MLTGNYLVSLFKEWGRSEWVPSTDLLDVLEKYLTNFDHADFVGELRLKKIFIYLVNSRLQINKNFYKKFIDQNAKLGITFNYHEKLEIEEAICRIDCCFHDWISEEFSETGASISLAKEIDKNRNKSLIKLDEYLKDDPKSPDVFNSIFSSFVYYSFNERSVHRLLNQDCRNEYLASFFDHLEKHHQSQISRKNGLTIINLFENFCTKNDYETLFSTCTSMIKEVYSKLDNHSYIAFVINEKLKPMWPLIADISIFCEKFIEHDIDKAYFRKESIRSLTKNYIQEIGDEGSLFEVTNEGLHYKDCYVTYSDSKEETVILLFEKNDRDEKRIPCPKCRTLDVQGNSYPVLGVKSWECKNLFCGDKSKYNRGKRYSLSSIIRQEAINDDRNIIPKHLLKKWRRDVVYGVSYNDILEFLIQFYSLHDDTVIIYGNNLEIENSLFGRSVTNCKLTTSSTKESSLVNLSDLAFFRKCLLIRPPAKSELNNLLDIAGVELYQGDAFEVLSNLESDFIAGAVTSPPYYNARDYSTWPNIYCYLYDMYNIGREVFRVLKSGAPYVFNIFDYFDNENSIVFSAMGKKRLILSSYISYIFRKIGFLHIGNCAWDKGEIQGNRNFNQGNLSPYYQTPHNCWEHIMVFSKGNPAFNTKLIPKVMREKPVFKIKKGINTYGHTAPYPNAIPRLLINLLEDEMDPTILDPFSGSMTSGREAYKNNIRSISVELHKEYCDLSMKMIRCNCNSHY